jgi:hypothetical protein
MTGWTLTGASDISADGSAIVGVGTNPQGFSEAFLVIVPEPSTSLLAGGACLLLAARRRGRTR